MKRYIMLIMVAICATGLWAEGKDIPDNEIWYKAYAKLNTTTTQKSSGLHTDAFDATIQSHTFADGEGKIIFQKKVTSVGAYAFYDCDGLQTLSFPSSVTTIGTSAVSSCSSLTSVDFPDNLTSIGVSAFDGCALTEIKIGENLSSIGEQAFYSCRNLSSVTFSKNKVSIGNYAFGFCTSLETIISNSVTPPTAVSSSFYSVGSNVIVYVPWGTVDTYKAATGWSLLTTYREFPNEEIPNDEFWYTSKDGKIITPYTSKAFGKTVLSNTYTDGKGVLKFSEAITSIGDDAFLNCSRLLSINCPKTVTSIGSNTFSNCTGLQSLNIPNTITNIGEYAFSGCSALSTVYLSETCKNLAKGIFLDCKGISSIAIPNAVESIGESAFSGCTGLVNLNISDGVKTINSQAFYNCINVKKLLLPKSVSTIGENAFASCTGLNSITSESETPPTCGTGCFEDVPTSVHLYVPCGAQSAYAEASVWSGFKNVMEMCEGNIPYDEIWYTSTTEAVVTPFSSSAFGATIVSNTYANGKGVIKFDGDVTSVGSSAFNGRNYLKTIVLPAGVSYISEKAFYQCTALTPFIIPEKVYTIGSSAFAGCISLTKLTIPQNVTSIGTYAFESCSKLKEITLPKYLSRIDDYTFAYCKSLVDIIIPDNVKYIDDRAFYYCDSLMSLVIPKNVQSMGSYVLANCPSLVSVSCECTTPPTITSSTFSGVSTSTPLFVPCGSKSTYQCKSYWRNFQNIRECSPSDAVLSSYYKEGQLCLCVNIEGSVCNDLVWVGSYNKWDTTVDNLVHFTPVTNYDGWYVAAITDTTTIGNGICGKVYQLTYEDSLSSDFQNGDSESWMLVRGATKIVDCNVGESELRHCSTLRPLVMISKYFKDHSDPCAPLENVILYTSTNGKEVTPNQSTAFGATITSNTYKKGKGILKFSGTVTQVGENAFYNCDNLQAVDLPSKVASIGSNAFSSCDGLASITIPASVTSIGTNPFADCYQLKTIFVDGKNSNFDSRDSCNAIIRTSTNALISGCVNTYIPQSVKTISSYAFSGCSKLDTLIIPQNVTAIKDYAFSGCKGLKEITCNASTPPTLGKSCFDGIGDFSIPVNVPCDSKPAYHQAAGWSSFTNIVDPCEYTEPTSKQLWYTSAKGTVVNPNLSTAFNVSIVSNKYKNGKGVIEFSDNLTTIKNYAFKNCSQLQTVTLPSSVTTLQSECFRNCTGLTAITLGNLSSIGQDVLSDCASLQAIYLPASTPPSVETGFALSLLQNTTLVIPCDSYNAYSNDALWKQFANVVTACGEKDSYDFVGAYHTVNEIESFYTIPFDQRGEVTSYAFFLYSDSGHTNEVCYTRFDADGNLKIVGIYQTPQRKLPSEVDANTGSFQFEVSGLIPETTYYYVIKALNNSDVVSTKYGQFTTGSSSRYQSATVRKVLRNGQIIISVGDNEYNIYGQPYL